MTFADAIQNLRSGQGTKRPSWGGYVSKNVTSEPGEATETGTITFKTRTGTNYVYSYTTDGTTTTWTAPATTVPMDADLFAAMIADDWQTASVADLEAARSGTGVW